MKRFIIFLAVVLFVILMMFAYANRQGVTIYYWPERPLPLLGYIPLPESTPGFADPDAPRQAEPVPMFVVIFGCFALGFAASWILGLGPLVKLRNQLRKTRKQLKRTGKEMQKLQSQIPPPAAEEGARDSKPA